LKKIDALNVFAALAIFGFGCPLFSGRHLMRAQAGEEVTVNPEVEAGRIKEEQRLQKQIAELIIKLGDDDYRTREIASRQLANIGPAARKQLEKALKDKDVERVSRVEELLKHIGTVKTMGKVDVNCTNGWMAISNDSAHYQTFTVPSDMEITSLKIRIARTLQQPADLDISLTSKVGGKPLIEKTQASSWNSKTGGARGVTRYMNWLTIDFAAKLKKGQEYQLVFKSQNSMGKNPWLVGCFYRNTLKKGQHMSLLKNKPLRLGDFDFVFELLNKDKTVLSSVPKGTKFLRQRFGPSWRGELINDGVGDNINKIKPGQVQILKGQAVQVLINAPAP
jgi:hypothetical protein